MAMDLRKYMQVFEDCVPVRGARMSAICDLTRREISTFPSEYFPIIASLQGRRLDEALRGYDHEDEHDVLTFVSFLVEKEYAMLVDKPLPTATLSREWDAPGRIRDAIIDVDRIEHDYVRLTSELARLGCRHLQLRGYSSRLRLDTVARIAKLCEGGTVVALEAIVKHDCSVPENAYIELVRSSRVIRGLTLHGADEDRTISVDFGVTGRSAALATVEIVKTTTRLRSASDCGTITRSSLLPPSPATFIEFQTFNGCLNRKISVDSNGEIRNCPAMAASFGNHQNTSLEEVATQSQFRVAWSLRKDEIEVCRDCQYRYVCTDCRALVSDSGDPRAKPRKCGYDPYTDTWSTDTMLASEERLRLPVLPG